MAETEASPQTADPDTVLQALREQAAGEKATADALTADVKALSEAITALAKNRDEIVKADLAYQKADYPKAVAAVQAYAVDKRSCVEASLGDDLTAARKLVHDFDEEVEDVAGQLAAAAEALAEAQSESATADESLAAAVASFAAQLALPTSLATPVGALAKLQTDLKAAIDGSDSFGGYVLDGEIIRTAREMHLPKLIEYRGFLIGEWNVVADAQQAAREADKAVAARQGALDTLTLRLAALTADRVAELRRRWAARAR
jgi:hypothetical protein